MDIIYNYTIWIWILYIITRAFLDMDIIYNYTQIWILYIITRMYRYYI